MSLTDQFTTLEALAKELEEKSVVYVLQRAIDADVVLIVPIQPDWHVFYVSNLAIQGFVPNAVKNFDVSIFDIPPHKRVFHMKNIECFELEKADCKELIQKDKFLLRTFDAVYVYSYDENFLIRQSAKKDSSNFYCPNLIPKNLWNIWQCFSVFNKPVVNHSTDDKCMLLQDIESPPGVSIGIGDIRILPADEARFRKELLSPASIEISGKHISVRFGELLDVYNVYRPQMRDALKDTSSESRNQVKEQLHQALQDKDFNAWASKTLRNIAIKLIFPSLPLSQGASTRPFYNTDGMPIVLATLLEKLLRDYSDVFILKTTSKYIEWLAFEPSMTEKEARAITSIIRLIPPQRGGRKAQKST
jgi:hypothetical protein